MDAETDQYAPELVRDNTHVDAPGTFASGYHLTADLVDEAIRMIADHTADAASTPWLTWLALGACHAPHQAPAELIRELRRGLRARLGRGARTAAGAPEGAGPGAAGHTAAAAQRRRAPPGTAWEPTRRRVFTRLQAAYAAMLDHADQHIGRLIGWLEQAGQLDNTLVLVLSDNGASQEGGPLGMVNAMGPYNFKPEPMAEKIRRIDDIGGPDTHSNFPHGWAMASNTPLRRYKQNTHGGGIRDPLVISWPQGITARGEVRPQFCHAVDLVPTLLQVLKLEPPATVQGVTQMPIEGESFAASLHDAAAPPRRRPQYFEMFGHRGLWHEGWKAVAFHPPGTPFEADRWELFHLDRDFSETEDLAAREPERLKALVELWWREAEAHQVLPLDDRFGPRFVESARRYHGPRRHFVFHAGVGHIPSDVAPDVRGRGYLIEAEAFIDGPDTQGVLIAHGDATSGYSLFIRNGKLVHDMNIGGQHHVIESDRPVPQGQCRLGIRVQAGPLVPVPPPPAPMHAMVPAWREGTLLIDGEPAGTLRSQAGFNNFVSWSGLDIGRNRASAVSTQYEAPFEFTGRLQRVTVTLDAPQGLDGEAVAQAEMARQ